MSEHAIPQTEIGPAEAEKAVAAGALLIDVRTQAEWDAARIPGAVHTPLEELARQASELDRERALVLYCRVGSRSGMAAEALRGAGFDAQNLAGGIIAWKQQGHEIEPVDGEIAGE